MAGKDRKSSVKIARTVAVIVIVLCVLYIGWWFYASARNAKNSRDTAAQYVTAAAAPAAVSAPEVEAQSEETSEPEQTQAQTVVDFEALTAASADVCGWISVPAIGVDYPIVHRDDSYYLTHSWEGRYSGYGAIFMEQINAPDFSDYHTIVYGHHMRDGSMFGALGLYADEAFYRENGGTITVYTPNGTRTYEIFSVQYADHDDAGVYTAGFSPSEEYAAFVEGLAAGSLYDTGVSVTREDHVLTLSTCAYLSKDRFVVHAKLVSES